MIMSDQSFAGGHYYDQRAGCRTRCSAEAYIPTSEEGLDNKFGRKRRDEDKLGFDIEFEVESYLVIKVGVCLAL